MLNARCQVKFNFSVFFLLLLLRLLLLLPLKKSFGYWCLENAPTAVDSSVSTAFKKANVIFLTKNSVGNEKNIEIKIINSKFNDETGTVTFGQRLWKKFGFFSE